MTLLTFLSGQIIAKVSSAMNQRLLTSRGVETLAFAQFIKSIKQLSGDLLKAPLHLRMGIYSVLSVLIPNKTNCEDALSHRRKMAAINHLVLPF